MSHSQHHNPGPSHSNHPLNRAEIALRFGNYQGASNYALTALFDGDFFGDSPLAENFPLYQQALIIMVNAAYAQPAAYMFYDLGEMYGRLNLIDNAELLYLEAITNGQRNSCNPRDRDCVLQSLERLAQIYETRQRHAEAKVMRAEAAQQKQLSFDPQAQVWAGASSQLFS